MPSCDIKVPLWRGTGRGRFINHWVHTSETIMRFGIVSTNPSKHNNRWICEMEDDETVKYQHMPHISIQELLNMNISFIASETCFRDNPPWIITKENLYITHNGEFNLKSNILLCVLGSIVIRKMYPQINWKN